MTPDALTVLNLPAHPQDVVTDGPFPTIYDSLRRAYVALTPEEWVRQNFVAHLIQDLGYPAALMANEAAIRLNNTLRRCDTIIYDRHLRPLVVVEYKAATVPITQKVFDQIARYNLVLGAPYLIVSNGLRHFCCAMSPDGTYNFLRAIPSYCQISK